jgi:hypothetical protein
VCATSFYHPTTSVAYTVLKPHSLRRTVGAYRDCFRSADHINRSMVTSGGIKFTPIDRPRYLSRSACDGKCYIEIHIPSLPFSEMYNKMYKSFNLPTAAGLYNIRWKKCDSANILSILNDRESTYIYKYNGIKMSYSFKTC